MSEVTVGRNSMPILPCYPCSQIQMFISKAISVVVIESITACNFMLIASLSSIDMASSFCNARLAELDDVVITCSASAS